MRNWNIVVELNKFLEYALLIIGFYLLFFTNFKFILIVPIFFVFFLFKLLYWWDKKYNLKVPKYIFTIGLLFVYIAMLGEFWGLYYKIMYYDKILHFVIPFYLVFLLNNFLGNTPLRKLFLILAVLGIGAVWEVSEWGVDYILGSPLMQGVRINFQVMQSELEDSMSDLLINSLGTLSAILFIRRKGNDVFTEE